MTLGKRIVDVARANLTGFASAFMGDEDARERARVDKELDEEIQREVNETIGARAGRRARKFADKAEEAWEQAYEAAQQRAGQSGGGGSRGAPGQREVEGWYRTLEVPVDADFDTIRKSYRRLIAKYHPDRFADEPTKYQAATEVTRKLTIAYNGLKQIHDR